MGNTFRSVARLIRALVHCNLAWEAMVENEILPDSPKTKQKYDAVFAEKQKNKNNHKGGAGCDGRRKPDIISVGTCEDCLLCIESVLGSEWKSKLKLMPSLGKAYEFMAEVLSSLLGVEVAPDDVVPRYFDQQGNQSFKATQKCLEQLTEKGVCLRLEPTPLAEMLNPTASGLSDPKLLAAGGNQKMYFDEACRCSVPRDIPFVREMRYLGE